MASAVLGSSLLARELHPVDAPLRQLTRTNQWRQSLSLSQSHRREGVLRRMTGPRAQTRPSQGPPVPPHSGTPKAGEPEQALILDSPLSVGVPIGRRVVLGAASSLLPLQLVASGLALAEGDADVAVLDAPPAEKSPEPTPEVAAKSSAAAKDECVPAPGPGPWDVVYMVQNDDINSCAYLFPQTLPGTEPGPAGTPAPAWILTRPPERYSSAAPLSPDARLRIVSERIFVKRGATVSVAISPPNETFLPLPPPSTPGEGATSTSWSPVSVARSVLADRTSPRMTTAQRLQETVIGSTSSEDICGVRYYYCEYLNSRSPTTLTGPREMEVYRHSVAATAEREGYLYTITASCLDPDWKVLGPSLLDCVESFRLLPPTTQFVPPWKDPWRFW